MTKQLTTKDLFARQNIQERFNELLGKKAQGFITTILQIVNQNAKLKNADPYTVLTAAATAATLDLPVNPNLGFAYIIPYEINEKGVDGKWGKRVVAQFQMGYKGFIQLGLRTEKYQHLNAVPVYENQFKRYNTLTEHLDCDFYTPGEGNIVGYAAEFRLLYGFEKRTYWTKEQVDQHAKRYSKSYGSKKSQWTDPDGDFDGMALKTVLKYILSKYGPLSIEMQTAIQADQAVQTEEGQYKYVDNEQQKAIDVVETDYKKERARIVEHIETSKTTEEISMVFDMIEEYELEQEYNTKYDQLESNEKKTK